MFLVLFSIEFVLSLYNSSTTACKTTTEDIYTITKMYIKLRGHFHLWWLPLDNLTWAYICLWQTRRFLRSKSNVSTGRLRDRRSLPMSGLRRFVVERRSFSTEQPNKNYNFYRHYTIYRPATVIEIFSRFSLWHVVRVVHDNSDTGGREKSRERNGKTA